MHRFLVLLCLSFTLAALSACSSDSSQGTPNQPTPPDEEPDGPVGKSRPDARKTAELLSLPLAECPELVWPGATEAYGPAQVVVTDIAPDGREAYLWQANNGEPRIETLDPESLADEWFSSFTFSHFRGRKTLGFNIGAWYGESVSQSTNLWRTPIIALFHENFHLFVDTDWNTGIGNRKAEYPVRWEPRYLRAQLMQALERALLDGTDLAAASYWHQRYLVDYSNEAARIAPIDITEGAATYAERFMVAIATQGCNASETVLLDEVRANLPSTHHRLAASSESYELGALSGTLLRERGPNHWQSRVEAGETLQDVLLDGVAPEQQPDNEQLREQVQIHAASRNDELAQQLGESLGQFQGDTHHRLVLDSVRSIGSYSMHGSFMLVDQPLLEGVNLSIEGQYDHGAIVSVNSVDTFDINGYPCQASFGRPAMVLVPESAITFYSDGTADTSSGPVQFSGLEVETIIWNELEWLCPIN